MSPRGLNIEVVHIPAGPFIMGSSDREVAKLRKLPSSEWYERERPQHTVQLMSYHIGRYPLTVGEFRPFVQDGGYQKRQYWTRTGWEWRTRYRITAPEYWDDLPWCGRDDLPVIGVSWFAAVAYCHWLSKKTGTSYRLPTEPEWEKAARGTDGRIYPWAQKKISSKFCNVGAAHRGNHWDNKRAPRFRLGSRPKTTVAVGNYSPQGDSPYRCADMAGNVWEWCSTPGFDYPVRNPNRPVNLEGNESRGVRGGSWYHSPVEARCAARYLYYPGGRDNVVGFRVVR